MKSTPVKLILLLVVTAIGVVPTCWANSVVNGNFESVMTGWTAGTYYPPTGIDYYANPPGANPTKGQATVLSGVGELATFGAQVGAVLIPGNPLPEYPWYGQTNNQSYGTHYGIYQPVTVSLGDTIKFDYRTFISPKPITPAGNAHFDAYLIAGSGQIVKNIDLFTPVTVSTWNNNWQTSSHTINSTDLTDLGISSGGSAYLGFFAWNEPSSGITGLYGNVDNVTDTPGQSQGGSGGTPELGTFALMGLSMLPMAGVALRRRRKAA